MATTTWEIDTNYLDDCGNYDSTFTNDVIKHSVGNKPSDKVSIDMAVRFQSVGIVQGVPINEAYLQLYLAAAANDNALLTCYGIKEANTADFTTTPFGRSATTASVNFSTSEWPGTPAINQYNNSPDISAIVSEIMGQSGWVSGNNLGFFLLDNSSPDEQIIEISASRQAGDGNPAKLYADYDTRIVTGNFLRWVAADTTGVLGALQITALSWRSTQQTGRNIADDDDLKITDQDDVLLLEKRAASETDGIELAFPTPIKVNGIKVPELDGGELHIWTKDYTR